jgi:hypothetical protein
MGEQNIAGSADSLRDSLPCLKGYSRSGLEENFALIHVRSADEYCPLRDKLVRAWPVFAVVAIFHEQNAFTLEFGDCGSTPPLRHGGPSQI